MLVLQPLRFGRYAIYLDGLLLATHSNYDTASLDFDCMADALTHEDIVVTNFVEV